MRQWLMRTIRGHAARHAPGSATLAALARAYLDAHGNLDNFDLSTNGEAALLRRLGAVWGAAPVVLFDVGANHGDWTALALAALPGAAVHAFEIMPPTAEALDRRWRDEPRVHVHACGLGRGEAEVTLYCMAESDTLTSTLDISSIHGRRAETASGSVVAGAAAAEREGVARIDLLKIDVEGAEHEVLAGFEPMLAQGAVRAIQFEYGFGNALSRHLLRDHYAWLEGLGYRLGRLHPFGVVFGPYAPWRETLRGGNYVAVAPAEDALRAALERF